MKFFHLTISLLMLLLMLTIQVYAEPVIPEGVPEWALRPALEPGEDPEPDAEPKPDEERGYTTIYDMDGSVLYTDDPSIEEGNPQIYTVDEDTSLFFSKPFSDYTVTEGMLLLFLILGFISILWYFVKGAL